MKQWFSLRRFKAECERVPIGIPDSIVYEPVASLGFGVGAKMAGRMRSWACEGFIIVALIWVAVKELKLSYYTGETLLFTIYTHYGNLI